MSGYRVTFPRVVHAEWTKLFALRSTWVVFGAVAVLSAGLAGAIGHTAHHADIAGAFLSIDVFSLILGVFGILLCTGEYQSGLIRATFAAVPHRLTVLGAKAVVLAAATVPLMVLVGLASLAANRIFAGHPGLDGSTVVRATAGAVAAPVALALLGLGLGALVRHTATAITTYVLTILVLPVLLGAALPERMGTDIVRFVPVSAAQAMYAVAGNDRSHLLAPGAAALVTAAWVVAMLVAGGVVLQRQDP